MGADSRVAPGEAMPRGIGRWLAGWLLLALAACGSGTPASTGLLLEVDADEASRGRIGWLEVEVQGRASGSAAWSVPSAFRIDVDDPLDWPRRAAIQPKGDPVGRGVRVVVRGYEPGADVPLVVARAATTFLPGRWLLLSVRLEAACHGVACDTEQSCVEGACREAWRPARDLPDVFGPSGGGSGHMAGSDAGAPDGEEAMEAQGP